MGAPLTELDAETRAYLIGSGAGEALSDLAEKYSGASLERVTLDDGRRFVLKRLLPGGDWLARVTGAEARVFLLWSSGLLDEVRASVDHTIVDCVDMPAERIVIMRDASAELIAPIVPVSRGTSRLVLAGLARLHRLEIEGRPDALCSVAARYALFAPQFHAQDENPGAHPLRTLIVEGWATFYDLVPQDVGAAVGAVHTDPGRLAGALAVFPSCLLHGDVKLENLGLGADRLVLIDWGDLTGFGPPEVDVAWYALRSSARIGVEPSVLFDDYPGDLNSAAIDLACLGSLAQMGFRMANSATRGRPEPKEIGAFQLDWWTRRVQSVLDSLPL